MDMLIKIAAVCVPAALIAGALKKDSPAMAMLVALAAGCVVIFSALGAVAELTAFLREVADAANVSPTVLSVLMKAVGIAVISGMTAELCRDAGLSAAASACRFAGSASALYVAMPLMRGVLRMIRELL